MPTRDERTRAEPFSLNQQRAHVDPHALEQARADLGVVTSRANTGGAHAVQWSLKSANVCERKSELSKFETSDLE